MCAHRALGNFSNPEPNWESILIFARYLLLISDHSKPSITRMGPPQKGCLGSGGGTVNYPQLVAPAGSAIDACSSPSITQIPCRSHECAEAPWGAAERSLGTVSLKHRGSPAPATQEAAAARSRSGPRIPCLSGGCVCRTGDKDPVSHLLPHLFPSPPPLPTLSGQKGECSVSLLPLHLTPPGAWSRGPIVKGGKTPSLDWKSLGYRFLGYMRSDLRPCC